MNNVITFSQSPRQQIAYVCSTTSAKHQNIQHSIIIDKEKQQLLTFERLKPDNVWHFFLIKIPDF